MCGKADLRSPALKRDEGGWSEASLSSIALAKEDRRFCLDSVDSEEGIFTASSFADSLSEQEGATKDKKAAENFYFASPSTIAISSAVRPYNS